MKDAAKASIELISKWLQFQVYKRELPGLSVGVFVEDETLLVKVPLVMERIENLTYSTATDEQRKENRQSWNKWDVIGSAIVLGLVLAFYVYFSLWLN